MVFSHEALPTENAEGPAYVVCEGCEECECPQPVEGIENEGVEAGAFVTVEVAEVAEVAGDPSADASAMAEVTD